MDYNVIWLDEDYAMEYDCRSVVVTQADEYCVHFMSRAKTIDGEKLQEMIQFAGNALIPFCIYRHLSLYIYFVSLEWQRTLDLIQRTSLTLL